jgi:hypothetical protein
LEKLLLQNEYDRPVMAHNSEGLHHLNTHQTVWVSQILQQQIQKDIVMSWKACVGSTGARTETFMRPPCKLQLTRTQPIDAGVYDLKELARLKIESTCIVAAKKANTFAKVSKVLVAWLPRLANAWGQEN